MWADEAEKKLRSPGGVERQIERDKSDGVTVGDLIRRYISETDKSYGVSKADYLRRLQKMDFSNRIAEDLDAEDWLNFAHNLRHEGREPSTVAGLYGTLAAVMELARSGWRLPIDIGAIKDARFSANSLGYTGKSKARSKRPTLDELDALMEASIISWQLNKRSLPLHFIIAFAIFSGRRQAEIVRLKREDVTEARVVVRDVKNPYGSAGNHMSLWLTPEARRIYAAHDRAVTKNNLRLFPYHKDTIGRRFTWMCSDLGIEDLRFHDLRHECCSWLSETGWTAQQIMKITGHSSLHMIQRYVDLEDVGNKYENWKWFDILENL